MSRLRTALYAHFAGLLVWLPLAAAATPVSVLLIGDSITAGQQSQPLGDPYATVLAEMLGEDFAVTQVGCGGSSSRDWTRSDGSVLCGAQGWQIPNLYEARARPNLPADVVTVLLGANDAVGYFEPAPVDPEDYGAHLAELVDDLLADGAEHVILMTPTPNFQNAVAQLRLSAYRDEVLALCGSGGGVVCGPDLFTLLEPGDFATGNLHPNGFGHFAIADALDGVIHELVPEPGTALLLATGLAALALRSPGSRGPRPRG